MKKFFLLLFVLVILSGCSITRIDNYNYEEKMDKILSLNIKNYNRIGKGYKYYAPYGIKTIYSNDYNDILERNGNKYYLYVDVVSYYYKSKLDYKEDKKILLSKKINNNNKKGYIKIKESNKKLYVQMVYNYAKIESYVDKSSLDDAIIDISYILSSLDYNDSLLKKMYESGNLDSKEEVYKLFNNKEKKGNFLEYIKEYDKYDEKDSTEVKEEEIKLEEKKTTNEDTNSDTTNSSEE